SREQADGTKLRGGRQTGDHFGLDGQSDGQQRCGEMDAWATDAIQVVGVPRMGLAEQLAVGTPLGVATCQNLERAALGGEDTKPAALLGEESPDGLRRRVVRD